MFTSSTKLDNNRLVLAQATIGWVPAFTYCTENKSYIIPFNTTTQPTGVFIDLGTNVLISTVESLEHSIP